MSAPFDDQHEYAHSTEMSSLPMAGGESLPQPGLGTWRMGEARTTRKQVFIVSKLYPWNASRHDTKVACERSLKRLAYSPLDQGKLNNRPSLAPIAARLGVTPSQVALAWLMHEKDVVAIPKSSRIEGVDEILGARRVKLDVADIALLNKAFPPPKSNARMETT